MFVNSDVAPDLLFISAGITMEMFNLTTTSSLGKVQFGSSCEVGVGRSAAVDWAPTTLNGQTYLATVWSGYCSSESGVFPSVLLSASKLTIGPAVAAGVDQKLLASARLHI